jgi:methyl-accepting chemotaxis protein
MSTLYTLYIFLMLLIFFYFFIKVLQPYRKSKKEVEIIREKLDKLNGNPDINIRINDFNTWVNENSKSEFMKNFMQPSWKSYYDKFIQFKQKGMPITPDVYDFFLEDTLMQRIGKRKLVEAIPGAFLAMGIIGTFFGIAWGVSFVRLTGDPDTMKNGIGNLLAGMKVKFVSSIAGILLSLVWQFVDKMSRYPILLESFHDLRQSLDIAFPTQEQGTVLSQMLQNQEKQMEDFQSFVTEMMIPTMVTGITDALNQTLTPHLEQTNSMVENMVNHINANQAEGMNAMIDRFVSSLNEITGDHMKDLGDALKTTIEWQQRVHSEMSALVQSMQDSAKEQSNMVEKTTELTGQINTYTEKISDYHHVMEETIKQLNETTEKNTNLHGSISELLDKMTEERKVFHTHFNEHLSKLKVSVNSIVYQTEQQLQLNSKLESNLLHFNSLSESQKDLSESLSQQAVLTKDSNEKTSSLLQKINEAGSNQVDLQKEINAVLQSVLKEKANVGTMVNDLNDNLIIQLSDMDKRIEHLRQVWETTSHVFTTVNKQLGVSMNQFTDDMHRGLEHTFKQFDDELSKSVNYLAKAVSAIYEGVSDLPDSIQVLKTSVTELNKHSKALIKTV